MRVGILLALLLLAAPIAYASATTVERPTPADVVQPLGAVDAPVAPGMNLDLIQAEQHTPANHADATMQDMPRRWSFWWVVGALVVAGVILAVVT